MDMQIGSTQIFGLVNKRWCSFVVLFVERIRNRHAFWTSFRPLIEVFSTYGLLLVLWHLLRPTTFETLMKGRRKFIQFWRSSVTKHRELLMRLCKLGVLSQIKNERRTRHSRDIDRHLIKRVKFPVDLALLNREKYFYTQKSRNFAM